MSTITLKVTKNIEKKYKEWQANKEAVGKEASRQLECTFAQLMRENNKLRKQLKIAEARAKKKESGSVDLDAIPQLMNLALPPEVRLIANLAVEIRKSFPFGGKEHHFQAALERELQAEGYFAQQEVARLLHYQTRSEKTIQLPHDIRGREDILLEDNKLILELKQTKKLTKQEFQQLFRYMEERQKYSDWGYQTRGMLINFGDNDVEVWFSFYNKAHHLQRVFILQETMPSFDNFVDTWKK
ncbi:MAG: GxxExxY protein [Candidatus Methanofastidiosia archaeon]